MLLIVGFKIMLIKATVTYMYMNTKRVKIACVSVILSLSLVMMIPLLGERKIPFWIKDLYSISLEDDLVLHHYDTRRIVYSVALVIFLAAEVILELFDWLKSVWEKKKKKVAPAKAEFLSPKFNQTTIGITF